MEYLKFNSSQSGARPPLLAVLSSNTEHQFQNGPGAGEAEARYRRPDHARGQAEEEQGSGAGQEGERAPRRQAREAGEEQRAGQVGVTCQKLQISQRLAEI